MTLSHSRKPSMLLKQEIAERCVHNKKIMPVFIGSAFLCLAVSGMPSQRTVEHPLLPSCGSVSTTPSRPPSTTTSTCVCLKSKAPRLEQGENIFFVRLPTQRGVGRQGICNLLNFAGLCRSRTYGPLIKSPTQDLPQDIQQEESAAKGEDS